MALMFPRLARNFAKNGYYPTDEATLERTLNALAPSDGLMCICDPCAGEGVAIAEAAHALGQEQTSAYAVEFDQERANHARLLVDHCIHGDLMDTMISRQAFGLLWLNPPYGDLARDANGNLGYEGKGRGRLEKLFYQRTLSLLQYGGILVFIIPSYVLDQEMIGWLTRHFADLSVFQAVDKQFKQIVIFGRRVRQREQTGDDVKASRTRLLQIGLGELEVDELPHEWTLLPYVVPTAQAEPEHFYRISMEPEQFADEVRRLKGLWPAFETHLGATQQTLRAPARALSQWHLALALAAGAISGVVQSPSGRILAVKGDTFKQKSSAVEYRERDDGSLAETRILTDKFVPVIRAWDLTPSSPSLGQVLTIH
ncbi:TPA: class I SAM-dependent methyltransferase [Pseudomonas aeruginosa]|uniref:DUF6094 domain-containing protein n=1 Tax=Pseudomonas TaxID=286 RepID=UPI0028E1865B|nr:class I SAM-dependent methyltransferase [Pseudomonas aeruginosa]HEI8721404.1 class I SAM-dependent methyltransferase [Serratia marcescens]MCO2865450.1 class I SAM-dependent methyltransferase [Pseudomonas aeruginosa]MCO3283396.1 class I SAM-dependent methyltransferase [Pseudomonas aeruginosa]MDV6624209.1 class I SAM-dependent methyltransferase [Pseudomonas aeruginosa]